MRFIVFQIISYRELCGVPPSTQNLFLFLFLLPIACLNFEQTIAGISISIHFRTVVANSNNFQTHPVCNLLSTNEINPSENICNNNVMQNGISKILGEVTLSMTGRGRAEASVILTPKIQRIQWLYVVKTSGWRTNY